QADEEEAIRIVPASDLKNWVVANFLTLGGPLHNPDHDHIAEMLHDNEGFLASAWASTAYTRTKRMVLGQCEKVMFQQGGWKKARQEQQMRDWFGFVPIYLITIDASFCEKANDNEFCALFEHELYHIGVERDSDGEIIYSDHTGLPKHYLAGHDVEEFIGVVKRWGANDSVKRLVEVAKNPPFVSDLDISKCCGNCVIT
ncbi:putative metallopeptidase, partial [Acinetobacter baumannii]